MCRTNRNVVSNSILLAGLLLLSAAAWSKDHYFGAAGGEWGKLKTRATPDRAAVFVDGQFVGHADQFNGPGQELFLHPGEHEIRFSLTYYNDFSTRVNIQPNQTTVIRQNLDASTEQRPRPPFGTIKFRCTTLCKAAVLVNGRFLAHADEMNGPRQRMELERGTYKIELLQAGYQPFETTVTVEPNQTTWIEVNLVPDGSNIYTQR
jgi:hypothetical protein